MTFVTETIEDKQKILIVSEKKYPFINLLQSGLKKHGVEIFLSPHLPKTFKNFDYLFLINQKKNIYERFQGTNKKVIGIDYNQSSHFHNKNHKTIDIVGNDLRKEHIDRILWFAFSQSEERLLKLIIPYLPAVKNPFFPHRQIKSLLTKKNLFLFLLGLFIIIHTAFIIPLLFSLSAVYSSFNDFKNEKNYSPSSLRITKSLYSLARPTLLLFSLALPFDNLIDGLDKANIVFEQSFLLTDNIKQIEKLLFKQDKTQEERAYLILRMEKFKQEIQQIEENLIILSKKLPTQFSSLQRLSNQMMETTEALQKLKKLFPYFDNLLADNTEKKYLIFFANNMELRPGGGFLGSFGVLKVKDYTIEDIEIHDVYDADGQLIAHIDPPEPIRKYLQIPHGFLRDSNFFPDFPEDYEKAKLFLEKEINLTGFSGSILLTTTAIENLLGAFDNIYLPDFNENINQKNFYLKAQIHTEKKFFPGSIQKKTFLGSLARHLLINLDTASPKKIAQALKKSLDEKQIIVYFEDQDIQKTIDPFYWSGRTIDSQCIFPSENTCVVDYLYPFDANVGANKVNFFITRSMYLKTNVNSQGQIQHVFSVQFRNESPAEVFPGGTYKNFFQVMVPLNVHLRTITKDGVLVEDYSIKDEKYKTIQLYFELPPKKTTEIKISYSLDYQFNKGKNLYQLIVQKQIGSANNDYVLELDFPQSIYISNQNFTPLVKDNHIVYNTNLTADKIFFIELSKE